MKKLVALFLSLVMAAAVLAGCSSDGGNNTETKAAGESQAANQGSADETQGVVTVDDDGHYTLTCANMNDPGTFGPYGSGGSFLPYNNVLYESPRTSS